MIPEITIHNTARFPKLGLGTWEMGGRSKPDHSNDDLWLKAIGFALESGIRHIDTAAIYGAGHSEELVGKAIRPYDRSHLLITSKVSGDKLRYDEVLRSAAQSLKNLGTEYIDLLLIHWPNPAVPLSETMKAFNRLLDEKSILHFGLSNFPVSLIREVMQLTDRPILTNQIEYNVFTRNKGSYNTAMEREIIPFCLEHGISITAWRPVMKGDATLRGHATLASVGEKYGLSSFQVALNWLCSKPLMMAIPKMSSEQHIRENIQALSVTMDAEDYELLNRLGT